MMQTELLHKIVPSSLNPENLSIECNDHHQQPYLHGRPIVKDSKALLHLIKSCGKQRDLIKLRRIHGHILLHDTQLFATDIIVGNALVSMYTKCFALSEAQDLFDNLPLRNVVTWNALISGYSQQGHGNEAINLFKQMMDEGVTPNEVTYICVLKACGSKGFVELGEEICVEVTKKGLLSRDIVLGTSIVDMYARCNMMNKAQEVFGKLPKHDIVAWNVLISGYAQQGLVDKAIKCFEKMQQEGFRPNAITLVCLLKACSATGSLKMGEYVHAEVNRQKLLENNVIVGNALVDMYAKCNMLKKAEQVFSKLQKRDVVCWNAMISGYVQHGYCDEATNLFTMMQDEGLSPNVVTFICILKACASIGYLEMGEEIHERVMKLGIIEKDIVVGTAIVDMYAKCGMLGKAQQVFDELPVQNIVSWNALIAGYGQMGQMKRVVNLLVKMMEEEGITPDIITFLTLLNAHSHEGLVEEGQRVFDDMGTIHWNLTPTLEHYTCMVDLFSCVGRFDKAIGLIEKVSISSHRLPLWWALLGACCKWVNVEVGRWAFEQSLKLNGNYASIYVCMRNIYAAAGMHEEANDVECWRIRNESLEMP